MGDRLLNAPLMKFTINKKYVIASVSKCDCNERQYFVSDYTEFNYFMLYVCNYDLEARVRENYEKRSEYI